MVTLALVVVLATIRSPLAIVTPSPAPTCHPTGTLLACDPGAATPAPPWHLLTPPPCNATPRTFPCTPVAGEPVLAPVESYSGTGAGLKPIPPRPWYVLDGAPPERPGERRVFTVPGSLTVNGTLDVKGALFVRGRVTAGSTHLFSLGDFYRAEMTCEKAKRTRHRALVPIVACIRAELVNREDD